MICNFFYKKIGFEDDSSKKKTDLNPMVITSSVMKTFVGAQIDKVKMKEREPKYSELNMNTSDDRTENFLLQWIEENKVN